MKYTWMGRHARKGIIITSTLFALTTASFFISVSEGHCHSLFSVIFGEESAGYGATVRTEAESLQPFLADHQPVYVSHGGDKADNEGLSHDCLLCHDGTMAKAVDCQNRISLSAGHADPIGSHSVEVPYPLAGQQYNSIREASKLGLRFPDGRVSCITCHDLRLTGRAYNLPVPMDGSRLCFSCHIV